MTTFRQAAIARGFPGVMGASYAAGTQYIAQYRDADGPKNHFLGGLCMTPFFYPMSTHVLLFQYSAVCAVVMLRFDY